MFPDSAIASKFVCGERKCNHLATFGIAPYFERQLLREVKASNEYVVMFDESLNSVLQSKQMDVMVTAVAECCDDPLFVVKVNIFLSFAKDVTLFLTKYQTDMPMLPFMCDDLFEAITDLAARFIKEDVMKNIKGPLKLLGLSVHDRSSHLDLSAIDIGFATDRLLRDLRRKKVNDKDCFAVRQDAKKCLVTIVDNLVEKSPLKQGFVRNLAWSNPLAICKGTDRCVSQLKRCLQLLSDAGHVKLNSCDSIIKQFKQMAKDAGTSEDFINFKVGTSRIDTLFHDALAAKKEFTALWVCVGRSPKDAAPLPWPGVSWVWFLRKQA